MPMTGELGIYVMEMRVSDVGVSKISSPLSLRLSNFLITASGLTVLDNGNETNVLPTSDSRHG